MLERVWKERNSQVHCWWEGRLVQHYGEQLWSFPRKLKTEPLYDPAILLLGIYLEKIIIQKDTRSPVFIATVFTTKTWKQCKCSSTDKFLKCGVHTHTHTHTEEYYSATKKNEIMPFAATWVDLEIIILSEISQRQKDNHHMVSLIFGL